MNDEPDISRLARTIGDATRIRMLTLLMKGGALTAKELAYGVDIEPATATAHLRRLLDDKLLDLTTQGRHKYFRLASPDVARLIESLMVVAPQLPQRGNQASHPIRMARFCYDHLAGQLGTQLTEVLLARGLLLVDGKSFATTTEGEAWFRAFGIDLQALRQSRRQFAYQCLDWSERRDHLAGALGAALAQRMIALGWLLRNKHSRVVDVTEAGRLALLQQFGIAIHCHA